MDASLWNWAVSTASGAAGLRTAWTWAFLEAIVLPLPPEILLIPLVLAHPQQVLPLGGSAVIGSVMGGCVSYLLGHRFGDSMVGILKRLPGVSPERVLWTSAMLRRLGARFIALSPWLIVPYKITSVLSGWLRIAWWRYLLAGTLGRGTRLISVTGMVGMMARGAQENLQSHYLIAVLLAYAVVGGLLWLVRRWVLVRVVS